MSSDALAPSEEWFRRGVAIGLRAARGMDDRADMLREAERIEMSLRAVPSGELEWQSWMAELELQSWAPPRG